MVNRLVLVLVGISVWVLPASAHAATITVTDGGDSGAGTFRQAVADAVDNDTIDFAVSAVTLIDQVILNKQLTIDGGSGVTITQTTINGDTSRVLRVSGGGTVSINDVTISGGQLGSSRVGGGMLIQGTAVITRSTITGNDADNGGGFYVNGGTLTLVNTTVSGNTGGNGAGVWVVNGGTLNLSHSTVAGNTTTGSGGGLLISSSAANLANSIVAGNSAATGPDISGTVVSFDYNLIQDATGATITGATANDITGVDPLLGALTDNGGSTATHAIDATSPAWDTGGCDDVGAATVTEDQRGIPRPIFTACDIGAFEYAPGGNSLISVTVEPTGVNCANGGQRIDTGTDYDDDGTLDANELATTTFVCDGADGLNTLVAVTDEAAGANCTNGGKRIDVGVDDDASGVLDAGEIDSTEYVCDGGDGSDGSDGLNTLVTVTDEAAGANCTNGGKRIDVGVDDDDSGVLDAGEIDSTEYVCDGGDGSDGADGLNTLTSVTDEPAGANCPNGGMVFSVGVDDNDDGTLDAGEVDSSTYICNGSDGTGTDGTNGTDGMDGADGGCQMGSGGAPVWLVLMLLGLVAVHRRRAR